MANAEVAIDLMELADLAQPRKLAWEIHRQLRLQFGAVPPQIPLAAIAAATGIVSIEDFETDRFEGTLVIKGDQGAIGLRRGMMPGRRNFTLGHELGHFLNPWHRRVRQTFECKRSDTRAQRTVDFGRKTPLEQIEVEANEFSAALLVPMPEYRGARRKHGRDADLAHIRALATTFAVSQEFMGRIYVEQADEKIALVYSKNGAISSFVFGEGFPFLGLRRGAPVPATSLTRLAHRRELRGNIEATREVRTDTWLERQGRVEALFEQVVVQREGWVTTMLRIEESENDGDDE